jgi:transglutaminase-like putative cysteine protease
LGVAVRLDRWLDHLPPWLAWGAVVSTGLYEPMEAALMAAPLAAAGIAEARRWEAGRFRRWLEAGALLFFLWDLSRGAGVFTTAVHTLFLLAGLRLALPRERPQQRQLLLMGFLLFLTSAMGPSDPGFLVWALAWLTAAAAVLLSQSWEDSAALRRGSRQRPPLGRTPLWALGAALFGAALFVVLPRASLGLRPAAFFGLGTQAGQAGLSDRLDLAGAGPVQPNPTVVLRIVSPSATLATDPAWRHGLRLLRGVVLETARGARWEMAADTPRMPAPEDASGGPDTWQAEFFLSPTPRGILPLPYGTDAIANPPVPIRSGWGASLRWRFPVARSLPLQVAWLKDAAPSLVEGRLTPRRWAELTALPAEDEAARRWSLRLAPGILPAAELARTLEAALRTWRYTLDNPSGGAANPLEDFLDRTQAGHCEYFASAMALMLRARGVPARVVNGYRLGPWIAEGGYFRVSQDQAHSWVEYWDQGAWHVADPTPAAPPTSAEGGAVPGLAARWLDALTFRWDRYVVRFSSQDQLAGLDWFQRRAAAWHWHGPGRAGLAALVLLGLLAAAWRTRRRWRSGPASPDRVKALRPLLARLRRRLPPQTGETARAWLLRLAAQRPERREPLLRLADAVDAEAYGGSSNSAASTLAKAEAAAWRGWKPRSPSK